MSVRIAINGFGRTPNQASLCPKPRTNLGSGLRSGGSGRVEMFIL